MKNAKEAESGLVLIIAKQDADLQLDEVERCGSCLLYTSRCV